MQRLLTFSVLTCFFVSACGGAARPKLKEIEETFQSTSGLSIDRTDIDYNDKKIDTITFINNNTAETRLDFDYNGDEIALVAYTDLIDADTATISFEYKDGRVTNYVIDFRDASGDKETTRYDITYSDKRVRFIEWTETNTIAATSTSSTVSGRTEFDYDGDDRIERITEWVETTASVSDFDYDDDGLLDDIVESQGSTNTTISFSYNDDNRIKTVSRSSGNSYSVSYSDKKIDEIRVNFGGGATRTTRYTYGKGDIDGLIPTPDIPWGNLFDLEGDRIGKWEILTGELLTLN